MIKIVTAYVHPESDEEFPPYFDRIYKKMDDGRVYYALFPEVM